MTKNNPLITNNNGNEQLENNFNAIQSILGTDISITASFPSNNQPKIINEQLEFDRIYLDSLSRINQLNNNPNLLNKNNCSLWPPSILNDMINLAKNIFYNNIHLESETINNNNEKISFKTASATILERQQESKLLMTSGNNVFVNNYVDPSTLMLMEGQNKEESENGIDCFTILNDIHSLASSTSTSNSSNEEILNGYIPFKLNINKTDNNKQNKKIKELNKIANHNYRSQSQVLKNNLNLLSNIGDEQIVKRQKDKKAANYEPITANSMLMYMMEQQSYPIKNAVNSDENGLFWQKTLSNQTAENDEFLSSILANNNSMSIQHFLKGIDFSIDNLFNNRWNSLQEINLRLLVLTIQWIKNMPLFLRLNINDQVNC